MVAVVRLVIALAVVGHGIGDGIGRKQLRHPFGLLHRLLLRHGGGEEIGSQPEPLGAGLLEIVAGIAVLGDGAVLLGPVAQPDHDEIDPGSGHRCPVHGTLISGNVHAQSHLVGLLCPLGAASGKAGQEQHHSQQEGQDPRSSFHGKVLQKCFLHYTPWSAAFPQKI